MTDPKNEIAACWNKSSARYDSKYGHGIKSDAEAVAWREALNRIVGCAPLKILDVGTGTGFLAIFLAELGHVVKGVDLSEGMMSKAKEKAARDHLNISFEEEDAEALTYESDEYYDVVINRHLLWTLLSPEKALLEWKRVLKPGGRVVIIDGNWANLTRFEKFKKFIGQLLIAMTELRNPWKNDGSYSKELTNILPMKKKDSRKDAKSIVENVGFINVSHQLMEDVDKAERGTMPFKVRLTTNYKRNIVIGMKP